jgi:hypothetical protein
VYEFNPKILEHKAQRKELNSFQRQNKEESYTQRNKNGIRHLQRKFILKLWKKTVFNLHFCSQLTCQLQEQKRGVSRHKKIQKTIFSSLLSWKPLESRYQQNRRGNLGRKSHLFQLQLRGRVKRSLRGHYTDLGVTRADWRGAEGSEGRAHGKHRRWLK